MKAEFTIDELKKSVKNHFYDKLNRKAVVSIRHEDYEVFSKVAKQNGERVTPEDIMRRCLADYAKTLNEDD